MKVFVLENTAIAALPRKNCHNNCFHQLHQYYINIHERGV